MRPRIKLFDPADMNEQQRQVYESIVNGPRGRLVGPLRAVLRLPKLAFYWSGLGEYLRYSTAIPARLTELSILVTARHWNSQVEWEIHSSEGRAAGIPEDIISAIGLAKLPKMDDMADAEVYEFTRQLLESGDVENGIHSAVVARWGETGVIELTAVIGYYSLVSFMLSAQGIPTPSGTESLEKIDSDNVLTKLPPAQFMPATQSK